MNAVFTDILYGAAAVCLAVSFVKDRRKTALALQKAWKMFRAVLPQFLSILLLMGLLLAVVTPATIRRVIGAESGFAGMLLTSLLGAIAPVPVLIAFPVAAELLRGGAGITQIAVFISTLTTVGMVTLPMEMRTLGKKTAILRNGLAYLFSFAAAFVIGAVLQGESR